jgi:CRP-like cAMP-binding protein/anti-anti-sigma regulatory factor
LLSESGHRIAVIEIEGTIFFGTAEALAAQAEALADEGTDFVLFDLKRLHAVDATGFKVLGQTFARLRKRGTTLGFSYVIPDVLRDEVAEDLMVQGVPEARMWPSTDRALEYFEEGLLMKLGADEYDEEGWSIELFGAEWGLAPEQCAKLAAYLRQREFDGGEFLFEEGDTDRSMFLLRKGFADLSIQVPESERRLRVSTASRGTVLGEISMLDGFPRSASAMAASPILAYELTYDDFQRLLDEEPEIGVHFLAGVSETLAKRLRRADDLIIELET